MPVKPPEVPDDSIGDLDVALRNAELVSLIYGNLPLDLVLSFYERAVEWEQTHVLASRLANNTEQVAQQIDRVPGLQQHSRQIARSWAAYRLHCHPTLYTLLAQLERGTPPGLSLEWHGLDEFNYMRAERQPTIVLAPHIGVFQAVPLLLAALGERSALLTGTDAINNLVPIVEALAPRLRSRCMEIPVPGPVSAPKAAKTLKAGGTLVIYPEFDLGVTGDLRVLSADFLGRPVRVPVTAARFARIAQANIISVTIKPAGHRRLFIEFGTPIEHPSSRADDSDVSLEIFRALEQQILAAPHLWWSWPMLDSHMALTQTPGGQPSNSAGENHSSLNMVAR